jgi:hypothetical protein
MVRINPDRHVDGYLYAPTRAVTAMFGKGVNTDSLLRELVEAGFVDEQIDIFVGEQGAYQFDAEGKRHGPWVRFRRFLERMLDETHGRLHRIDETLRNGGCMIEVLITDLDRRHRVIEVLKIAGGIDVIYWGRLVSETR